MNCRILSKILFGLVIIIVPIDIAYPINMPAGLPSQPILPDMPGKAKPKGIPSEGSRARSSRLIITTNPSGANVSVGMHVVGETPLDIMVRPGHNVMISVNKNGYIPQELNALLRAGHTLRLDLILDRITVYVPYVP